MKIYDSLKLLSTFNFSDNFKSLSVFIVVAVFVYAFKKLSSQQDH